MNKDVAALEPKEVWTHFEMLNAVPRPSKKEERVIAFMKKFGEDLGLETEVDESGNVLIRKPASKGMENRKTIVLQSHLDMVHQKNSDSDFNFDTMGIQSYIDGDWVKANGTTLGADNGMGVASIMSVLANDSIEHGPIEAFFTIDEETGMTGAFALQANWLRGDILLNLDSEDEGELYIGCAGGIDTTIKDAYSSVASKNTSAMEIQLRGLKGGHSGMDIILGRGNANILMNRLLISLKEFDIELASFDGGSLRNAIPREANAHITYSNDDAEAITSAITSFETMLKAEFGEIEPALKLSVSSTDLPSTVLSKDYFDRFTAAIAAAPNGVRAMSKDIEGLTETSCNMARVLLRDGQMQVQFLSRSSVESRKDYLCTEIASVFTLMGADSIENHGAYPGWEPNPDSPILKTMKEGYERLYGSTPKVMAIHAGLECGILGQNYPDMDMISFGPTIRNPHSPDEKVHIKSVSLFWNYLLDTLKHVPAK